MAHPLALDFVLAYFAIHILLFAPGGSESIMPCAAGHIDATPEAELLSIRDTEKRTGTAHSMPSILRDDVSRPTSFLPNPSCSHASN